jgi:hypothetical protein
MYARTAPFAVTLRKSWCTRGVWMSGNARPFLCRKSSSQNQSIPHCGRRGLARAVGGPAAFFWFFRGYPKKRGEAGIDEKKMVGPSVTPRVELCHLGHNCAPGIVIDDILRTGKKHLFQLIRCGLDSIVAYLGDCERDAGAYRLIYDRELLRVHQGNVRHARYGFEFQHDYHVAADGLITNHAAVEARFDEKIGTFRAMLASPDPCVFVTFLQSRDDGSNFTDGAHAIGELAAWLARNKRAFRWVVFADAPRADVPLPACCSLVVLQRSYARWWLMDGATKRALYEEIYRAFVAELERLGVPHGLPAADALLPC